MMSSPSKHQTGLLRAVFTLLTIALLAACMTPKRPTVQKSVDVVPSGASHARVLTEATTALSGKALKAKQGDIELSNAQVAFVIASSGTPSGGQLIDAGVKGGPDLLESMFLYLDDTYPRQAKYAEITILQAGGPAAAASVKAVGVDTDDENLAITTTYTLKPDASYITIRTTIENKGSTAVLDYELGDAIQWGLTTRFAPGYGTDIPRKKRFEIPWMGGDHERGGYALADVTGAPMNSIHGGSWSDTMYGTVSIKPGESATYTRRFAAAESLGAAVALLDDAAGAKTHTVRGKVVEADSGDVLDGVVIDIKRVDNLTGEDGVHRGTARPYFRVYTDDNGTFKVQVPPGRYELVAQGVGRSMVKGAEISAPFDMEPVIELSKPGEFEFTISNREAKGKAKFGPGRLTFVGVEGTATPTFGAPNVAPGAGPRLYDLDGQGKAVVPPGTYDIYASRGPEFDVAKKRVVIKGGEATTESFQLNRVVDTTGYIAGDFHQHAAPSPDSSTLLDARVLSNVAEGVELMVSTDHNYITDYAPVIKSMAAGPWITSIVGNEMTTGDRGHINGYPLRHDPESDTGGAVMPDKMTPKEIFSTLRKGGDNVVVQINHPRSGRSGFFDRYEVDPKTTTTKHDDMDWGFDVIEVANGKRPTDTLRVMEDWFNLLNRGEIFTAMGNSDTHLIVGHESGFPRTLVHLGSDDVGAVRVPDVINVLKKTRRATVSNGIFVSASIGDAQIGGTATRPRRGDLMFDYRVQAPAWVDVTKVEVIADGKVIHTAEVSGGDVERAKGSVKVPASAKWLIVRAMGTKSMAPIVDAIPYGFTNPIWVK